MKNNNAKKIIFFALVLNFVFSGVAEAKAFNFKKNILERQKANVSSSVENQSCDRLKKIGSELEKKVVSVANSSNESLTDKTTSLQEAWAKEDSYIYSKRAETSLSLEKKFNKLEEKISEENKTEFNLFKNRVFSALEKRNSSMDLVNEEYRNAIFSYLAEYSQNKKTYFDSFEKEVSKKVSEKIAICAESKDRDIQEIQEAMDSEKIKIKEGLGGDHFREFVEQKRKEREQKMSDIKATFEKEISDARRDFTDF